MKKSGLALVVIAVVMFSVLSIGNAAQYEIGQISFGAVDGNVFPDTNNTGEVVWEDQDQGVIVSSYRGIVSPRGATYPSISNAGEIIWLQRASSEPDDLQIFSNTRGQLTFGEPLEFNHGVPKVNSLGEVVYAAYDGAFYQIYSTVRGQITFDAVNHNHPAINDNGEIIWTELVNAHSQVFSNTRGQLTFDSENKWDLDLNNNGEFSYSSTYQLSGPHIFSSVHGVVIPDDKQHQWFSGINDHGDIVFSGIDNEGEMNIFFASIKYSPILAVKINDSESSVTITNRDSIDVSIFLEPADYADEESDWWLIMKAPNGYFSLVRNGWRRNVHVWQKKPLEDVASEDVVRINRPLIGKYTFFFCIDTLMDGKLDLDKMFCDSAEVNVVRNDPRKPVVVAKNLKVGNQKIVAGSNNNSAASFTSDITAEVVIEKAYVIITPASPGSLLTELRDLSLWVDNTPAGAVFAVPALSNKFLINLRLPKSTKIFDVKLGIKAGTPIGHSWTTRLYLVGHNIITGRPFITTVVNGQKVTVVKGEIEAYESFPTIPDYKIVPFGSQDEYIMEVNFNAVNDGSNPNRLKLSLNSWQAGCSVSGVTVKYKDINGKAQSLETSVEISQSKDTAKAVMSGLNFYVPKNSIGSLKFYISFREFQSTCGLSGVGVILTLNEFEATSSATGERVTVQTKINSRPVYVYKSIPRISTSPVQQPLGNGIQLLNKTIIGANIAGDIGWNELSYEAEKSAEVAFANAWLIDSSTGEMVEGTITVVDLNAGSGSISGTITFLPAAPQRIPGGGQKEYHLFATISGVTNGSYVSTWIGQHSKHESPTIYDLVAGPYYTTFIWSDLSASPHSEGSPDWNNSYCVPGLPMAKQTKTK